MNGVSRIAGLVLFAASAAAGCVSGGATAGASPGGTRTADDCLFAVTLRDWRPLDERNLILFADGRRGYHVELFRPALGLTFDVMIGVYDRDGRICPYGGDAIVIDGPMPERIEIRSIKRLSDEELDELYVRFGVRAPAVIEATSVEPTRAETSTDEDAP
jgi:hypothetical protein